MLFRCGKTDWFTKKRKTRLNAACGYCKRLCFRALASAAHRMPCKIKSPRTLVFFFLNKIYVTNMQFIACEKLSKFFNLADELKT